MLTSILILTGIFSLMDKMYKKYNIKGEYYINHFIGNSIISYYCIIAVVFNPGLYS